MAEIEYQDIFKGKPRKMLILEPQSGSEYRVFVESAFVGSLSFVAEDGNGSWKTTYNLLKPIAGKLGAHIERIRAKV